MVALATSMAGSGAMAATQLDQEVQEAVSGRSPVEGAAFTFPVQGTHAFRDDFGVARPGGRKHHGVDIFADKGTPVVAAADGVVEWMQAERGGKCCALGLLHPGGWRTWYLHLNNDTPGTDDGLGWGFAEGIEVGAEVAAGSLLGWVGDSGNAEETPPHLHFELHLPDGRVANPYPYLMGSGGGLPETLPFTGEESLPLAGAAMVLIVTGTLLLWGDRRLSHRGRHRGRWRPLGDRRPGRQRRPAHRMVATRAGW